MSPRSSAEATPKELIKNLVSFMEMGGRCNKKRKISHQQHDEDDEDDEEKMEKFFAIIRSIKEARDRLMGGGGGGCGASSGVGEKRPNDNDAATAVVCKKKSKPVEVWKPSFEREDFIGEADRYMMMINNPPPPPPPAASKAKQVAADRKDEDLDLKLSL